MIRRHLSGSTKWSGSIYPKLVCYMCIQQFNNLAWDIVKVQYCCNTIKYLSHQKEKYSACNWGKNKQEVFHKHEKLIFDMIEKG